MKNYEDLLQDRVQDLTRKLAQKQREGNLAEELSLCIRLAQLHLQLDAPKASIQFWQSCTQIATDLKDLEECWRAAAEISKIYCKANQLEAAEAYFNEHLQINSNEKDPLRLSLLKVEVIVAMGQSHGNLTISEFKKEEQEDERVAEMEQNLSVKEFLAYERALGILDEALDGENNTSQNVWWLEGLALRGDLLKKLAKFEETRYEEAIEVFKALQNVTVGNVLMSMRIKAALAQIYFEMREYSAAFEFSIAVIDLYNSHDENSKFRPRRRIYCEMLWLAGRVFRFQKDFKFSLTNLMLAKDEAVLLAVERELMDSISESIHETMVARAASEKVEQYLRKELTRSPKELEELAGKIAETGCDFEKQQELLEQCRAMATNPNTQKRLDGKLIKLYFYGLRHWQGVINIQTISDWRGLMLKGRAYERLGRNEEAEACFMEALKEGKGNFSIQSTLYFHYILRGRRIAAEKYRDEALSLETILNFKKITKIPASNLIDPNFSYFATRKPSNSLMKMVGSGMVMKTKTKKTKGLQLRTKRAIGREPGISTAGGECFVTKKLRTLGPIIDSDEGMSDFIVSDNYISEESSESEPDTFKFLTIKDNSKSSDSKDNISTLCIISSDVSSELDPGEEPNENFVYDSPLLIRTENLDILTPIPVTQGKIKNNMRTVVDKKIESDSNSNSDSKCNSNSKIPAASIRKSKVHKVIVRFTKGKEVIIPITGKSSLTVKELIRTAQVRFESLFPDDFKQKETICGLSLGAAMLFEGDLLESIVSRDFEILQAHFGSSNKSSKFMNSESEKFELDPDLNLNSIEEDFKRKFQLLNLKGADTDEIKDLKVLQERFKASGREGLNISCLQLDSKIFSNLVVGSVNKFLKLNKNKTSDHNHIDIDVNDKTKNINTSLKFTVNLKENLLVDEDLERLMFPNTIEYLNFSMNFFQKPMALKRIKCEFVDLSYNPIDIKWFLLHANSFFASGINLIGCFESTIITNGNENENENDRRILLEMFSELGRVLSGFLEVKITLPPSTDFQESFLTALCSDKSRVEKLELFGVQWQGSGALSQLSFLESLKVLNLTACTFHKSPHNNNNNNNNNLIIESALCKVLKRSSSLKKLILDETDLTLSDWEILNCEGLKMNFSIEEVSLEGVDVIGK